MNCANRISRLQFCRRQAKHSWAARSALLSVLFFLNIRAPEAFATKLQTATVQAWDRYVGWVDERVQRELSDTRAFLVEDFFPPQEKDAVKRQLEAGEVAVKRMSAPMPQGEKFVVRDGEIHHWWGAVLVPGVQLPALLRFLQDYDHHAGKFEDVERSRLITRDGNFYRFFFRLKRSKAFVTAIFNTEQECLYTVHSATRESSRSAATRIAEVDDPGKPSEREKPPGDDRGLMWRLVSWWRFEQTTRGVVVEVESASLSRDIPTIIKLIPGVSAYIRSTPKESLESILRTIRNYGQSLK